ncbi:MAG: VOC family protein [Alphaproteobacteria bacterium]|nr:VOC family protein [Alphaproteobacteria bacterium]
MGARCCATCAKVATSAVSRPSVSPRGPCLPPIPTNSISRCSSAQADGIGIVGKRPTAKKGRFVRADRPHLSALRRATVFVSDLARAQRFYCEAFAMSLWFERSMTVQLIEGFPVGDPGSGGDMRFVILRGWDAQIGMIGLIEIKKPPLEARPDHRLRIGNAALVIETTDLDRCAAVIKAQGGQILRGPWDGRNIGDLTGTPVPARVLFATDPDGQFLEVFQRS